MPLGEGDTSNEGRKRGTPSKRHYSTVIGSSDVKMVADRHRHAAYHNKHWRQVFLGMSTSMTLNDFEPPKQGVIVNYFKSELRQNGWRKTKITCVRNFRHLMYILAI